MNSRELNSKTSCIQVENDNLTFHSNFIADNWDDDRMVGSKPSWNLLFRSTSR